MEIDRTSLLQISEYELHKNPMALRSLQVLATGLAHLYECVRGVETQFLKRLIERDGAETRKFIYGGSSDFEGVPIDLIECAFRWYAVSLCDFVRVVTSLEDFDDANRKQYTREVLGPVQAFRDKVGAHTAGFTQSKRDNDAERGVTPCSQVAWNGNRFAAGPFTMRISRGEKVSDSSAMQPWQLTELHEQLCVRYPILEQLRQPESSEQ